MKPVYLGGARGYQSSVYRPGAGWSGTDSHRHAGPRPAAIKKNQSVPACPLTVARQRRPGAKTKVAIIATMAAMAGLLTLVLSGGAQL